MAAADSARASERPGEESTLMEVLAVMLRYGACLLVLGWGAAAAFAQQTVHTPWWIQTLGGQDCEGLAINYYAVVVGLSTDGHGVEQGFTWDHGAIHRIKPLPGHTGGRGCGINDNGAIVGSSEFQGPKQKRSMAIFVSPDGQTTALGTLGGKESRALDVNRWEQVVGWAHALDGEPHAFAWQDGKLRALPELAGVVASMAQSVQIDGVAAGWNRDASGMTQAVYWDTSGVHALSGLGGSSSLARDINQFHEIAGWAEDSSGLPQAVLWRNGQPLQLGTLGGSWSLAQAVNDCSHVVGMSETANGKVHAFLWEKGNMVDLNATLPGGSSWTLETAHDVNDFGEIVGLARSSGRTGGYMLMPGTSGLHIACPDPGLVGVVNEVDICGATGGATNFFFVDLALGQSPVSTCPGEFLDLARPVSIGKAISKPNGTTQVKTRVAAKLAGATAWFQAVEPASCRVSNLVRHDFP